MKAIQHIIHDFYPVACHAPQVGLKGAGGRTFLFPKHGNVTYQIKGDDQQTRIY